MVYRARANRAITKMVPISNEIGTVREMAWDQQANRQRMPDW